MKFLPFFPLLGIFAAWDIVYIDSFISHFEDEMPKYTLLTRCSHKTCPDQSRSIIPIVLDICVFVISTIAPVSSVEDRNGGEVEKSIKKQTCPEPSCFLTCRLDPRRETPRQAKARRGARSK